MKTFHRVIRASLAAAVLALAAGAGHHVGVNAQGVAAPPGRPIHVLFLGQDVDATHSASRLFPLLASPLARRGIDLTFVATPAQAFDPAKLAYYDALMIYGHDATLTPAQEKALIDFVEGGKGLIAIHSASAMFPTSVRYVSLVGGQSQVRGTGQFTATIAQPTHPAMQGVQPFATTDELLVYSKQNAVNRTVLMERTTAQGKEPVTWARTQGKGRVFYTALGHDRPTWSDPGFENLIQHGVLWAVPDEARQAYQQFKVPSLAFLDTYNVPNYEQRTPAPKYQTPFSPEDEQKLMQVPAEFSVALFASEPDVVKPIAMTFDERGRLWVIEAHDYPNTILNGAPGHDVIKILEDTNGDGRSDKVTVFADGINIASSLTLANGGLIVAAVPNMLFLKDTNGDDKADVRQVLSTGWGTRDTHAVPSSLQYGPDNNVWGVVGYSGFDGQMNGKPLQLTQGAYRFKPDGSNFEYLTRSTNNTWGLGFNETGDVFGSTANGDPSWYLGIADRYFEGVSGLPGSVPGGRGNGAGPGYQSLAQFTALHPTTAYIRQVDNQGFYTAGAGHMLYTARAFPKEFWNRIALINEPTAHLTGMGIVEPQGAGYVTRDGWNLVSSAEEWFAPVASMVGPDGAVWVADWYNFIAQHNPTPQGYTSGPGAAYETPMRDHDRGRIYRISYKGAPVQKRRSLSRTDPAGLVEALGADNMLWRLQAQRVIVERGQTDVVPQLVALVRNRTVDAIGTNGGAFHALWTLNGLGALTDPSSDGYLAAVEALKHPAAGVRKAAAMVLPRTASAATAVLTSGLLSDPDLHTRLAAVLVLADMPASAEVAQALYAAGQRPENYGDPWLGRALYLAANRHQASFVATYNADPGKMALAGLSVPLRLGALRPDWRQPKPAEVAADWKDMAVPGRWESRGLTNFDGTVWFTRTFTVAAASLAATDTIALGPVRNTAEVWVNGLALTATPLIPAVPPAAAAAPGGGAAGGAGAAPAGGGGRGRGPTTQVNDAGVVAPTATATYNILRYAVPAGTLRAGQNTLTVRVTNTRADGGFIGTAADMYVQAGQARSPLAGTWKYRVERSSNTGVLYAKPGELAAHVAFTAAGGPTGAAAAALPTVAATPDVVLQIGVVPNEMKFTTKELTVQAGQVVEVRFTNGDQAQHNFVIGVPGSLEQIGLAGDQLAASPGAAAQGYVPDTPQVLFRTALVNAGQTITFQFTAPATAGQYPYLCTFPAHWRIMNGILNVVVPAGRGGGGGRGGAAAPGARGGAAAPLPGGATPAPGAPAGPTVPAPAGPGRL